MTKVACVLVTHFRAKAEMRRHAKPKDSPAVIVDNTKARPLVVDSFPGASEVTTGMNLQQAYSRRADIIVLEADEPYYRKLFDQLLKTLQQKSDRVESGGLGLAYVGLDGLESLYGGEVNLIDSVLRAIPSDLNPRIGVAEGKFPAYVAALKNRGCGATRVPFDVASFLRPLSIDLLPVSWNTKSRLHCFGINRMGEVASLAVGTLQAQFGSEGVSIWELCNGVDHTPLFPLKYEETVTEYLSLPFYSTNLDVMFVALEALLKRAFALPQMRGKYASKATIECEVFNAPAWTKTFAFKEGLGDADRALFAIKSRMGVDLPLGPVEDVTLTLSEFTKEPAIQVGLVTDVRESRRSKLAELDRNLQIRMNGKKSLYRVVEVDPLHPVPEMRALQTPIDFTAHDSIKPLNSPLPITVQEKKGHLPAALYTGRHRLEVVRVDDFWRLDLWFMPIPVVRDYFRLVQRDETVVIVFRDLQDNNWYRQNA